MRIPFLPCLLGLGVLLAQAEEIAPASAQYTQEGRISAPPAAASPAPAPKLFPRKVWERVELSDGRVFEKVRVTTEDAATVTLRHSGGVAKVDKRALPEDMAAVHPYNEAKAEEDAARAEERRREAAEKEAERRMENRQSEASLPTRPELEDPRRRFPSFVPTLPSTPGMDAIETAVQERARRYFESEKRTGSGATLVFGFRATLDTPVEVPGWPNRWAVTGVADYKVYDSIGWGSFSSRNKKFRAEVLAAPGEKIKVLSFDER